MTQMIDQVEIIERIMDCLSEDCMESCKKIIENTQLQMKNNLDSEAKTNFSKKHFFSEISFIKILFQVYKNLGSKNSDKSINFFLKDILENLKNLLNIEDFNFFENDQQEEVCSIISSIFQLAFIENNSENFYDLSKFYLNILSSINRFEMNNNSNKKSKLKCLLKILLVVYESLEIISINQCKKELLKNFFEIINELKIKTTVDENEILIKLLLHECDEIAIQTLLLVVPQFIKSFNNDNIIYNIWNEITNMKLQNNLVSNSRILLIMCYLFDLCIATKELSRKKLLSTFFCDEKYWHLIQLGLCEDLTMKKQSMYLFKKTIEVLKNFDETIICLCENNCDNLEMTKNLMWDCNLKEEFFTIYKDVIVILEFLDEQQVHIIKPIFNMIEDIVKKICTSLISDKFVSFTWVKLIYQRALLHESTQIVKWGLFSLLKAPEIFFSDVTVSQSIASLLVSTLNNTSLYYHDGLIISQELMIFFKKMTKLKTSKTFFCSFIQEICNLTWSPEALFFVTYALAQTPKQTSWQNEEIMKIRTFIPKACRTHKKIIRCGIEIQLLNSVITLIDEKNVSLKNFILILASFTEAEILIRENNSWKKIIKLVQNNYSEEEAMNYLEQNMISKTQTEFNEKCCALMIFLFFDAFGDNTKGLEREKKNCFIYDKILQILFSFKNIEKRMYCDVSLYNVLLAIVCHLLHFNLIVEKPHQSSLLQILCLYIDDIASFIFMQIKQFSVLQDYYSSQVYIETFEKILKSKVLFDIDNEYILNNLGLQISQDLESYKDSKSNGSFIRIFCWMQLLKISCEILPTKKILEKFAFLKPYLMISVNELLKKNDELNETRDLKVLWGKINSEFLACKWDLLNYFIQNEQFFFQNNKKDAEENVTANILHNASLEALNIGGFGVLSPVISVFQCILFMCNESDLKTSTNTIWKLILERKKSEEYKILSKKFIQMLFQKKLMTDQTKDEIFFKYIDLIFNECSVTIVNIFMKHIQSLEIENSILRLLTIILAKGIIYGPVLEKGERLLLQVCKHIKSLNICNFSEFYTSNEVRGRSVEMLLTLNKTCLDHQIFAQQLISRLFEEENNLNKNKIRYFTDSYAHRIKHRVMQALLLLEPIVNSSKFVEEKLLKWLYKSLLEGNPQTSVKYQLEWLITRILMKDSLLLNNFWLNFDILEIKTKSMCSLISILHHLSKVISINLLPLWISRAVPILLPLCMDQHFELRLYAQVILLKFFDLAECHKLLDIVEKYKIIRQCILKNIEKNCQGNAGKNISKLQEDFYFNIFDPVRHYSLQTLYLDLPRLTNVGSDEWISSDIFLNCGVKHINYHLSLESENQLLAETVSAKWITENVFYSCNNSSEEYCSDFVNENYQKKIIPITKPLSWDWKDSCNSLENVPFQTLKKDGLIVVASLIDRIPNLGGLARTCEIFGAFEFIVGSLKFIEDKQFKGLSVTAEKWVTIKEVKVQNLLNYLIEMKQNGYTVIGAEQALHSQALNLVKFPKKSLLLLGNEKEGIPPNLLPWLDVCVEIPQVGIIRSLNVHVTGALFIWEYAKQNYF